MRWLSACFEGHQGWIKAVKSPRCTDSSSPCVFQAWTTARCLSRWSVATGWRAPRTAPSHCTSWCCSAGRRMLRSGLPSSTCKHFWRTTSQPLSLSTSLGTTSKPLSCTLGVDPELGKKQCCYKTLELSLPWLNFRDVYSLLSSNWAFKFHHQPLNHKPQSPTRP